MIYKFAQDLDPNVLCLALGVCPSNLKSSSHQANDIQTNFVEKELVGIEPEFSDDDEESDELSEDISKLDDVECSLCEELMKKVERKMNKETSRVCALGKRFFNLKLFFINPLNTFSGKNQACASKSMLGSPR